MNITSSAFQHNQEIPKQFTCEGENYNPPLTFSDIPPEAKSLALILEDPDTPMGITWYHWLLYNISPDTKEIAERTTPNDAMEGVNSWGTIGYGGPRPPDPKPHRYIFILYALDTLFDLPESITVPEFREAITDHILAEATLTGMYNGPAKKQVT